MGPFTTNTDHSVWCTPSSMSYIRVTRDIYRKFSGLGGKLFFYTHSSLLFSANRLQIAVTYNIPTPVHQIYQNFATHFPHTVNASHFSLSNFIASTTFYFFWVVLELNRRSPVARAAVGLTCCRRLIKADRFSCLLLL